MADRIETLHCGMMRSSAFEDTKTLSSVFLFSRFKVSFTAVITLELIHHHALQGVSTVDCSIMCPNAQEWLIERTVVDSIE